MIRAVEYFEKNRDFFSGIASFFVSLKKFFSSLPNIIEFCLWVIFISVVLYLILNYQKWIKHFRPGWIHRFRKDNTLPVELFGLDVREESLPDDLTSTVSKLWQEGKIREAISLLYRATLSKLIHQENFKFKDGFTELECATLVRAQASKQLSEYMTSLTRVWQLLAYAHHVPEQEHVDALCANWRVIFENE